MQFNPVNAVIGSIPGKRVLFSVFFLLLLWPTADAPALSAEWRNLPARERVILTLAASDNAVNAIKRTDPQIISISIPGFKDQISITAPEQAKIFERISPVSGGLQISLKNASFGYIVTSPAKHLVYIDLYNSQIGERWTPQPGPVPPAPLPAQPGSAAVNKPDARANPAKTGGKSENISADTPVTAKKPDSAVPDMPETIPQIKVQATKAKESPAPMVHTSATNAPPMPPPLAADTTENTPAQGELKPSSVYSGPIVLPATSPGSSAGMLSSSRTGTESAPPQSPPELNAPFWPPMQVPAPPSPPSPPVLSAPQSSAGALVPAEANTAVGKHYAKKNMPGPHNSFSLKNWNPFRTSTAYAASPSGEMKSIDVPFSYRGNLNMEGPEVWKDEKIPVTVNVQSGTIFNPAPVNAGNATTAAPVGENAATAPTAGTTGLSTAQSVFSQPSSPEQPIQSAGQRSGQETPAPSTPAAQTSGQPNSTAATLGTPSGAAQDGHNTMQSVATPLTQPSQTVAASTARTAAQQAQSEVIYVDKDGNPVPPPLDPALSLKNIEANISSGQYKEAHALAETLLKQSNLDNAQREQALHRRADALFYENAENPVPSYKKIVDSSTEAINFNTKSSRNAAAYLRLGFVNLKAKNAYEAAAYFSLLRRQFPGDESIPLSHYYWGDYQYEQGNLADAAEQFRHIVSEYPDSKYSRDAALGLTRTYYLMGQYEDAFKIIDYMEKRWPRFYLDYPPVLSMMGDVSYRVNQLDRARTAYWLYYNIYPDAEDADIILTRLGDIYYIQRFQRAAMQVYGNAVERFPSKDGGVISLMRLAEEGIFDDPTVNHMFKVFERPYNMNPPEAYRKIIREYPESKLVPLAQLKLAMWSLWQKDFNLALDLTSSIVLSDPNSPLAPRAREVALNAFSILASQSGNDKRYDRLRELWMKYPILNTQEEFLDNESRLALAISHWNASRTDLALDTVYPFFLGYKVPEYSELALILALTILVDNNRWDDVESLGQRVELWELTPETKRQLNYALALAHENKDKPDLAMLIWRELHEENALPPEQQAYADYFLARSAERTGDLEAGYVVGQGALHALKELAVLNPELADNEKIKNQLSSLLGISESAGLLQDALEYADEYLRFVPEGSSDYLATKYKISRIHKARGDTADWEKILEELVARYPSSVYGRTAASELNAHKLNSSASQFSPGRY